MVRVLTMMFDNDGNVDVEVDLRVLARGVVDDGNAYVADVLCRLVSVTAVFVVVAVFLLEFTVVDVSVKIESVQLLMLVVALLEDSVVRFMHVLDALRLELDARRLEADADVLPSELPELDT